MLLIIGGSQAFPLHTWKKQIILITHKAIKVIPPRIGTMNVQNNTPIAMPSNASVMRNLNAICKWNLT